MIMMMMMMMIIIIIIIIIIIMVLADQMESGPTGFLWCLGRSESD